MTSVAEASSLLGALAEPTRVRLLALLARHELSVAEITQVTELAQSRVSTHLGKLREHGLVSDRREGSSTFYRTSEAMPEQAQKLWAVLRDELDDRVLDSDATRSEALVRARDRAWPDAVAGQMERHYSPGRTWEATARGFLGLSRLGDVLDAGSGDGTLAALIAPRARSVTCLDRSEKVLDAARARLGKHKNVRFSLGDLLELPFDDASFDHVMLFNVLTCARRPERAIEEAARVLRKKGSLAIVTLRKHQHSAITAAYGHVVPGFTPKELAKAIAAAGLNVELCEVTSRERRQPFFEVITAYANKDRHDRS